MVLRWLLLLSVNLCESFRLLVSRLMLLILVLKMMVVNLLFV